MQFPVVATEASAFSESDITRAIYHMCGLAGFCNTVNMFALNKAVQIHSVPGRDIGVISEY